MSTMRSCRPLGPASVARQAQMDGVTCQASQPLGPQNADDLMIGLTLTTHWMLITGRRLGQQPLLHTLPAAELVDFWADDHADRRDNPMPSRAARRSAAALRASLPRATNIRAKLCRLLPLPAQVRPMPPRASARPRSGNVSHAASRLSRAHSATGQ
jgi:hypothetical protein